MKNLKATVSDFEGQYSAYSVATGGGWAYKGNTPNYDRAVDIGHDRSFALTTADTQALYGDTVALQVRNQIDGKPWPQDVTIYQSPLKLVSLALTFNKISQLMAQKAETGYDAVNEAFGKAAGKTGLQSLDTFFIIPASILPDTTNEEETVTEISKEEAARFFNRNPNNVILTGDDAASLLNDAHKFMLLEESTKPGFIAANGKLHLVGLFMGNSEPVQSLPLPKQDREPITQITSELRRILG